jgi:hypothetical protein
MFDLTKLPSGVRSSDKVSKETLVAAGYNHDVAEALEGRELTYAILACRSPDEVFAEYLEWNGIIGYTDYIRDALDNIRNVEAL